MSGRTRVRYGVTKPRRDHDSLIGGIAIVIKLLNQNGPALSLELEGLNQFRFLSVLVPEGGANLGYILGVHLGHDASASVINDEGLVLASVLQERISRIRHDYGLDSRTIDLALQSADISFADIERVGVSATQSMPAIVRDPEHLQLKSRLKVGTARFQRYTPGQRDRRDGLESFFEENLSGIRRVPQELLAKADTYFARDPVHNLGFEKSGSHEKLVRRLENRRHYGVDASSLKIPLMVSYRGIRRPGNYWSHHAAHAASNLTFNQDPRPLITHDGGVGPESGGIWSWNGQSLTFLAPHYLELGQLYDFFSVKLGLGHLGGAGKLMGLAPYGSPSIRYKGQIGITRRDFSRALGVADRPEEVYLSMWNFSVKEALAQAMDISILGNPDRVTEPAPASIANFMQDLVQNAYLELARMVLNRFESSSLGLSGGFALNCPTNSAIAAEHPATEVVVEPHCEDGGCSLGAAQMERLRGPGHRRGLFQEVSAKHSSSYAFMGPARPEVDTLTHVQRIRTLFSGKGWIVTRPRDISSWIADRIVDNNVVAILDGRSEIGPRALGNRSIIANPGPVENWARVNKIKSREAWRPFAPVVLEDYLEKYFEGGPGQSPFMLFNFRVKEPYRPHLGAVTHVDHTSRVQTLPRNSTMLSLVLADLEERGLPPIVLNTSFNGPGEPIVETVDQAIELFRNTEIDCLVADGIAVQKILPGR